MVITELWNGSITPCEDCGASDPEIAELIGLQEQNRTQIEKELSASQKAVLQKYIDCVEEYQIRMNERAFVDGFSLAAKLLMEALV